jgi:hypothetical protein
MLPYETAYDTDDAPQVPGLLAAQSGHHSAYVDPRSDELGLVVVTAKGAFVILKFNFISRLSLHSLSISNPGC